MPRSQTARRILFAISAVPLALFAFFIFLNLHEIAHTAAARLLGDPNAHYVLYESYPGGGYALGRNNYDESLLTPLAVVSVSLSAPLFTRMVAEGIHLLKQRGMRQQPRVFWWALYFIFRFDFSFYVLRNFIGDVFYNQPPEGQDIAQPIHILANGSDTVRLLLWALFIAITAADLWLSRRRIARFYRGKQAAVTQQTPALQAA